MWLGTVSILSMQMSSLLLCAPSLAGDFLRRLKTRYVADTDAQQAGAEDPEAFNWCGLLSCCDFQCFCESCLFP